MLGLKAFCGRSVSYAVCQVAPCVDKERDKQFEGIEYKGQNPLGYCCVRSYEQNADILSHGDSVSGMEDP